MDIGTIVLFLITLPAIGGLTCLPFRKGRHIAIPVMVTSAIVMVASVALLLDIHSRGVSSYEIGGAWLGSSSWIIAILDFALMLFFVYTGLKLKSRLVTAFGLLQLIPMACSELAVNGQEIEPALVIDYLAIVMALVINIVGSIICIYAIKYMEHDNAQPRFFAVMLLFLGAMNGAVFANNMLWLFFFWEVTTLCSYLLIGHEKTAEAKESAVRALVYTLGGGVALAFGIILVNNYYGSLSLQAVLNADTLGGIALLPLALMAIAAFTKSAQVPFQNWLLGAMVAPTPVSALLHSSTMVKLGVYLLIRMSPALGDSTAIAWTIALVGGLSFLATSIVAVAESNAKRVLAYSTIGNLGLITMCVGINTSLAISAAIILLLFHAISKALLFMCVGVVKHETGVVEIDAMSGLRDRMPFVSIAFAIGVFTIMLPPFGMFASKWLISEAAISLPLLTFLLAMGFAATIVYYSKWLGRIFSTGSESDRPSPAKDPISRTFRYTLGSLAVGAVMMSFLISWIVKYLVNPYIELDFDSSIGGSGAAIFSSLGEFPIVVLLVVVGAMFLLAILFARPKKDELSQPYTGGESYQFETGGFYLMSRLTRDRFNGIVNLAAVALLTILVLIPLAVEVGTWL
ncbi:MAG: NADH-quinone oxidoreductase subunit 5 family protein [Thermoplasmata archaeon]